MQLFITGTCGVILGILSMHFISDLYIKRDEKRCLAKQKKLSIQLEEKCAIALLLYGQQKEISEALVCEIEDIVFALAEVVPVTNKELETDTTLKLYQTLKNPVCVIEVKQGFIVGRIYSSLKYLYSL